MEHIFKKSFLEGYASADISVAFVLSALIITLVISLYIFCAYRVMTRKTFYSRNFNSSLVGVALITATIIVTIQSSIVVSLGMVGALSIVRFRTAIKDPLDLMFLFWAISTGIVCGAGFAIFAVALAVVLTIALILLNRLPNANAPQILVINSTDIDSEKVILQKIEEYRCPYTVKSRNLSSSTLDLTIELRTGSGGELVRSLIDLDGVIYANLMTHEGEVTF